MRDSPAKHAENHLEDEDDGAHVTEEQNGKVHSKSAVAFEKVTDVAHSLNVGSAGMNVGVGMEYRRGNGCMKEDLWVSSQTKAYYIPRHVIAARDLIVAFVPTQRYALKGMRIDNRRIRRNTSQ